MPSLLPHDLCQGRSSSPWLSTCSLPSLDCLSMCLLSPPALLSKLWPSLPSRESGVPQRPVTCHRPRGSPCLCTASGGTPPCSAAGSPVARGSLAWSPGWRVGGMVQPGQVTSCVAGVGLCQEQATWSLSRGAALWRCRVRSCFFSRALGGATRPGLRTPSVTCPCPSPGPAVQLSCGQGTAGEDARPRRARSPAEGSLGKPG